MHIRALERVLEKRQSHLQQQVESMRQGTSVSQEQIQMITEELDRTVSEEDIDTCMDNLIYRIRASARFNNDEIAFIIFWNPNYRDSTIYL